MVPNSILIKVLLVDLSWQVGNLEEAKEQVVNLGVSPLKHQPSCKSGLA